MRPGEVTAMGRWIDVCAVDDIVPDTAVCVLVGKRQIAVIRFGAAADLYALDNFDPFSKAFVLSRGIVGDRGGAPKIASPIYKQSFDLRTGQCLDDPAVRVPVYGVRALAGRVEILDETATETETETETEPETDKETEPQHGSHATQR
jgi:nitrite reductase (NADH) small subunit